MRIRYLITHAWGLGGTISTTLTNASSLAQRGHDVEVVSILRDADEPRFPVDPRVRLTALVDRRQALSREDRALGRQPSRLAPEDERRFGRYSALTDERLLEFLGSLDGGVLITTRPALNLAAAEHAPESVVRVGQEHLHLARHTRKPAQLAAMQRWYPRLDVIVSLTESDAAAYAETLGVRTAVMPNAVRPGGPPAPEAVLRDARVILAGGRLSGQKGFDRLIRAFARVESPGDWHVRIFGAGPQEQQLRRRARKAGSAVELPGYTGRLPEEMRESAAIFAMPSRFEGFPMVLLEAMGAGLPVVSFDFETGAKDLVADGVSGVLVPQDDIRGFAAALSRLMADPDLRVAMGRAGHAASLGYTPEAIAARWEALLGSLARP